MKPRTLAEVMAADWVLRTDNEVAAYTAPSETDLSAFCIMLLNKPYAGCVTVVATHTGLSAYNAALRYYEVHAQ